MKKIGEKALQNVFDALVHHYEDLISDGVHRDSDDFLLYLIGARYALDVALDLDIDSSSSMHKFFDEKFDEYFEGD